MFRSLTKIFKLLNSSFSPVMMDASSVTWLWEAHSMDCLDSDKMENPLQSSADERGNGDRQSRSIDHRHPDGYRLHAWRQPSICLNRDNQ